MLAADDQYWIEKGVESRFFKGLAHSPINGHGQPYKLTPQVKDLITEGFTFPLKLWPKAQHELHGKLEYFFDMGSMDGLSKVLYATEGIQQVFILLINGHHQPCT